MSPVRERITAPAGYIHHRPLIALYSSLPKNGGSRKMFRTSSAATVALSGHYCCYSNWQYSSGLDKTRHNSCCLRIFFFTFFVYRDPRDLAGKPKSALFCRNLEHTSRPRTPIPSSNKQIHFRETIRSEIILRLVHPLISPSPPSRSPMIRKPP